MDGEVDTPAVEEKASREQETGRQRERRQNSNLGAVLKTSGIVLLDDDIRHGAEDDDTDKHADTSGQEGGAAGALVETILLHVYKREGGEEKVEDTVNDGHVHRHERDDGSEKQELEGADRSELKVLCD